VTGIDHVVFCVADQWRGDTLGSLGTPGVVTPHLDALSADAVTFTNHFCGASPCGPSRRTIHTGTTIETHGQWINDDSNGSDLTTLAATVRAAGIAPTLVGYTDTPQPDFDRGDWRTLVDPAFDLAQPFVWQQGFPSWSASLASRGAPAPDHPFGPYAPGGLPDAQGLAPAHYPAEASDVRFLTDAALAQIDGLADRSLLHVNWLRPHPPMTPPAPWHRLVDPDGVALPDRLPFDELVASHPWFEATVPGRSLTEYTQVRSRLDDLTEQTERHVRAAYYGLCAEVDDAVGQLIASLQARGIWDRTLFIFTSDHGEALGDHWTWGRRGPYDGHLRVPCIIRDPRATANAGRGTRRDELTGNLDLFPTICDALDVETPASVEGTSLAPLLNGTATQWRDRITFAMSWADHAGTLDGNDEDLRMRVTRTANHRLVQFPTLPPLLHDLVEDPHEQINLAGDPAYRDLIRELSARR
jgi:arylsulfatase A-like enzyme